LGIVVVVVVVVVSADAMARPMEQESSPFFDQSGIIANNQRGNFLVAWKIQEIFRNHSPSLLGQRLLYKFVTHPEQNWP